MINEPLRPWFGDWPPNLYCGDEGNAMTHTPDWRGKTLVNSCLVVAFFLLAIHYAIDFDTCGWFFKILDELVLLELSRAVIIAALVGLVIDWNFSRKLAKDVFEAAVGHIMPPELRPELTWIAGHSLVCIESRHHYTFRRGKSPDAVIVECEWYRVFKNVGSSRCSIPLKLGIDKETTEDFPSRIVKIGYLEDGENVEWQYLSEAELARVLEEQEWVVTHRMKTINLARDGQIKTKWKFEIQKNIDDNEYISFAYPTRGISVTVDPCPDMAVNVSFGHRGKVEQPLSNTYSLDKTLLPGQYIRVRWRKKLGN